MKAIPRFLRVPSVTLLLSSALAWSLLPARSMAQPVAPTSTDSANHADDGQSAAVKLSPYLVQTSATGYGAQYSNSSSRLNLRYIDVPQTVNVVSAEFLQDANIFDSHDFVKYVNSIIPRTNAHQVETFFIRGLQTTQSYVDGFAVAFPVNRDSALIDRVEYVKGPASAAMGRGEAGGLVNFVSKSPLNTRSDSYSVSVGTDSFYRGQFDHNGLLGRTMAYRIPVYYEDGDNPRGGDAGKMMAIKKFGAAPSFLWHIRPTTDLTIHSAIFKYEGPSIVGAVNWSDKDIYRSRIATGVTSAWTLFKDPFVDPRIVNGFPGANRVSNMAEGSATLVHKFSESLSFRGGLRAEKSKEHFRQQSITVPVVKNPADANDYLVSVTVGDTLRNGDAVRGQGDLLYDKAIGSTKHQLLVGYDGFSNSNYLKSGSRGGLSQSMYNPSTVYPPGFDPATWVTSFTTDQTSKGHGYGYYGQYSGSFFNDHINVMGGWREDRTYGSTFNYRNNTYSGGALQKTHVPRYSITYKPTTALSIYYVHSEQADPTITRNRYDGFATANGATQWAATDPRLNEFITSAVTAELNEVGAKTNLLGDRVTVSAALYSIKRQGFIQNRLVNDVGANGIGTLNYNSWYTVSGESSHGFELEIFGQPTPRLTLSASYGTVNGTTIDATTARVPIADLIDSASIFGKYSFLNAEQNGFQVTAGGKLLFKGWLVLQGAPTTYSGDQYFIDAGISYQFQHGKYRIGLNANNLTDQFVVLNVNSQWAFRRVLLSFNGRL